MHDMMSMQRNADSHSEISTESSGTPMADNTTPRILVTDSEISDKCKSSTVGIGVAALQTAWFVLQYLDRWASHQPRTQLEVMTLAYITISIIISLLWWNKPRDIRMPIRFHTTASAPHDDVNSIHPTASASHNDDVRSVHPTAEASHNDDVRSIHPTAEAPHNDDVRSIHPTAEAPHNGDVNPIHPTAEASHNDDVNLTAEAPHSGGVGSAGGRGAPHSDRESNPTGGVNPTDKEDMAKALQSNPVFIIIKPVIEKVKALGQSLNVQHAWSSLTRGVKSGPSAAALLVFGVFFGGIHCLAWSSLFPTRPEAILWNVCAVYCAVFPIVIPIISSIGYAASQSTIQWIENIVVIIGISLSIGYVVCRVILFVLTFTSLRALPPGIYETTNWPSFLPHIG